MPSGFLRTWPLSDLEFLGRFAGGHGLREPAWLAATAAPDFPRVCGIGVSHLGTELPTLHRRGKFLQAEPQLARLCLQLRQRLLLALSFLGRNGLSYFGPKFFQLLEGQVFELGMVHSSSGMMETSQGCDECGTGFIFAIKITSGLRDIPSLALR